MSLLSSRINSHILPSLLLCQTVSRLRQPVPHQLHITLYYKDSLCRHKAQRLLCLQCEQPTSCKLPSCRVLGLQEPNNRCGSLQAPTYKWKQQEGKVKASDTQRCFATIGSNKMYSLWGTSLHMCVLDNLNTKNPYMIYGPTKFFHRAEELP